jgi:prevent-host-death family protein
MVTVSVRELKQQASELVRMVRETGEEVQVMYRGQVVALLIPVKPTRKDDKSASTKLDHLEPIRCCCDKTFVSNVRTL